MAKKATKKSTTKKAKKEEKILLTYKPIVSAARKLSFRLKKNEYQEKDGRQERVTVPRIEGLPMILEVHKDEIIEVTPAQLQQLEELGFVETEEEYKARQAFVDNLDPQHPDSLTFAQLSGQGAPVMTAKQSNYIYTDKLIRV